MIICPRCGLAVGADGCLRCRANKRAHLNAPRRQERRYEYRSRQRLSRKAKADRAQAEYLAGVGKEADRLTVTGNLPSAARFPMPSVPGDAVRG